MSKQLFVSLLVTWICVLFVVGVGFYSLIRIIDLEDMTAKQTKDIAGLKTQLSAKIPAKIKFYTIPGYNCDTSEIPGYCSNMYPVTQAECDKKNSHLFKVTSN